MNSLVLNLLRLLFDRVTAIAFSLRETFSLPSGPGIGRDSSVMHVFVYVESLSAPAPLPITVGPFNTVICKAGEDGSGSHRDGCLDFHAGSRPFHSPFLQNDLRYKYLLYYQREARCT
jgi:hypothetical protein